MGGITSGDNRHEILKELQVVWVNLIQDYCRFSTVKRYEIRYYEKHIAYIK